ncbi:MAG: hypothetical protein KY467_02595 [Gemmatimonadetes bacterium]|nr:hypothetical protein [Gemmatimonadota bacterium]
MRLAMEWRGKPARSMRQAIDADARTTGSRSARVRGWLAWAGTAALAAPTAVVLHELGHFVAAKSFGFPGVVLHYGSVSHRGAETGAPPWQTGLQAAAGPLVTLVIVLGCVYAVGRSGPRALPVAAAFGAGVRSILIGTAYLLTRILHPSASGSGNFDELNAARSLGLSPDLLVGLSMTVLLAAWIYLFRSIPPGQRLRTVSAVALGTIAGLALYIGLLGPTLLP